jgi:hypothetical protein
MIKDFDPSLISQDINEKTKGAAHDLERLDDFTFQQALHLKPQKSTRKFQQFSVQTDKYVEST